MIVTLTSLSDNDVEHDMCDMIEHMWITQSTIDFIRPTGPGPLWPMLEPAMIHMIMYYDERSKTGETLVHYCMAPFYLKWTNYVVDEERRKWINSTGFT